MAITVVGASNAITAGGNLSVALPTGATTGDLLIAVEGLNGTESTWTAPSGWTKGGSAFVGGNQNLDWWWKVATSGDTGPFAFNNAAAGAVDGSIVLIALRSDAGAFSGTPIAATGTSQQNSGGSNTGTALAISSFTATDVISLIMSTWQSSLGQATIPTGFSTPTNGYRDDTVDAVQIAVNVTTQAGATSLPAQNFGYVGVAVWDTLQIAVAVPGGSAAPSAALPQIRRRPRVRAGRSRRQPPRLPGNIVSTQNLSQTLSASSATTAAMQRDAAKNVTATSASSAALNKQLPLTIVVASASTPAVTKQVNKPISASSSSSASLSRSVGKLVTAVSASVVSFVKAAAKTLSVTSASAPTMLASRFYLRTLSVASASSALIVKQVSKTIAASSVTAASFVRNIGRILTLSSATSASIAKQLPRSLSAVSPSAASISRLFPRTLTTASASAAAIVKQAGKLMSTSSGSAASLRKLVAKTLTAASASAVSMLASKFYTRALNAASASVASLARLLPRTLAASSASSAAISRQIGKTLTSSTASAAVVIKAVTKTLLSSSAAVSTLAAIKVKLVTMLASSATVAVITRAVGKPMSTSSAAAASVVKRASKTLSAASASSSSVAKQLAKTLSAASATVATQATKIVRGIVLAVISPASVTVQRAVTKTISVTSPTAVQVSKGLSRLLSTSSASSANLVRQIGKTLSVTSASTASFGPRAIGKTLQLTSATASTVTKRVTKTLSASTGSVVTIARGGVQHFFQVLQTITSAITSIIVRLFPAKTNPPPVLADFAIATLALVDQVSAATYLQIANNMQPQSYWRLDDNGTTYADQTGLVPLAKTGTVTPTPGLVTGDTNAAALFDGTTGQLGVAYPAGDALAIRLGSRSWVGIFQTSQQTRGGIYRKSDGSNANGALLDIGAIAAGNLRFVVHTTISINYAVNLADGKRHHFVAVLDRVQALALLYVDGVLVASQSASSLAGLDLHDSSAVAIGQISGAFFAGVIDEFMTTPTALTPGQAASLASAATASLPGVISLLDSPIATLALVDQVQAALGTSVAPQGNWVGAYGQDGYVLFGFPAGTTDTVNLPLASLFVAGTRYDWLSSTPDVRALQAPDKSSRNATTLYSGSVIGSSHIFATLTFPSAYTGMLHIYMLDWDGANGRAETVTITDSNGSRAVAAQSFSQGLWIHAPIVVAAGGSLTVDALLTAGANAVLAGIFLGGASLPGSAALIDMPIATVTLLDFD